MVLFRVGADQSFSQANKTKTTKINDEDIVTQKRYVHHQKKKKAVDELSLLQL